MSRYRAAREWQNLSKPCITCTHVHNDDALGGLRLATLSKTQYRTTLKILGKIMRELCSYLPNSGAKTPKLRSARGFPEAQN